MSQKIDQIGTEEPHRKWYDSIEESLRKLDEEDVKFPIDKTTGCFSFKGNLRVNGINFIVNVSIEEA